MVLGAYLRDTLRYDIFTSEIKHPQLPAASKAFFASCSLSIYFRINHLVPYQINWACVLK